MGLMWATDLKTGLKGSVGAVLLLARVLPIAAHAVYCMPCVMMPRAHNAEATTRYTKKKKPSLLLTENREDDMFVLCAFDYPTAAEMNPENVKKYYV